MEVAANLPSGVLQTWIFALARQAERDHLRSDAPIHGSNSWNVNPTLQAKLHPHSDAPTQRPNSWNVDPTLQAKLHHRNQIASWRGDVQHEATRIGAFDTWMGQLASHSVSAS